MQTLEEALDHTPTALLQEMARFWGVSDYQEAGRPNLIAGLLTQMEQRGVVRQALRRLDDEERDLLRTVLASGGRIQAPALVQNYGPLRTQALAPDDASALNPTERLHRKGFLFRTFSAWEGWQGAAFFVPAELWPHLPRVPADRPEDSLKALDPQQVTPQPTTIHCHRDMACLLALFHRQSYRPHPETGWATDPRPALDQLLSPQHPAYSDWLLHLARQARLLAPDLEGALRPTAEGQQWLRAAPWLRVQVLFRAWRDHPTWDDLAAVPQLTVKRPFPTNLTTPRRRLLHHLRQSPRGAWLSLAAWTAWHGRADPEFLRPAGLRTRLRVQDRESGERLRGPASWDAVEGRYLAFLLQGPLHWLGLVEQGRGPQEGSAFRLTPLGQALLHEEGPPPLPEEERIIVEGTFEVWVPLQASPYAVYLMEGIAERIRWDHLSHYRLTRPALQRALERAEREGRSAADAVERLLGSLQRYGRGEVPQNVAYTLQEWAAAYGQLQLEPLLLLRAAEAVLLEEILADPRLQELCGERLSPTAVQVEPGTAAAVVDRLIELGHLPQVQAGVPQEDHFDLSLAPRQGAALLGLLWAWAEEQQKLPRSLVELSEQLTRLLSPQEIERARRQQARWQNRTEPPTI